MLDKYLKINLQLFADDDDSGNVVDSHDDDTLMDSDEFDDVDSDLDSDISDDVDSEEGAKELDFTEPVKNQSKEENSQFAKMRRKAEEEARKKVETELAEERNRINAMKMAMEQQLSEKRIIDEYLNPKKIWEYAENEGVSEEIAEKMLKYEAQKVIEAEKANVKAKFEGLQSQKRALQKDRYFSLLEKDVESVLEQRPDLDFQTVYFHMKGMKAEELEKQIVSNAEKRTIANIQDRARRRSLGSDGGTDDSISTSSYLDRDSLEASVAFGVDPRKIAKYVKNNLGKKKG